MSARLLVALTLLAFPVPALAQQSGSVGTPLPGSFASGERSEVRPEGQGEPWDPTSSELDRLDTLIRRRAITGQDKQDCHYGPVELRIAQDRLPVLFHELKGLAPAEAFQVLLDEPEDPNVAPVSILIPSPYTTPLPEGVSCPDGDVTAKLLEERNELVSRGVGPSQSDTRRQEVETGQLTKGSTKSPELQARDIEGGPVLIHIYNPDRSELEIVEAIMRSRSSRGLDRLPNCYYGPGLFRIALARVNDLLKENPGLSGDEYWRWFNEQPQDPKERPLTILVRSGTLPDCTAGDLDNRLRQRRNQLRQSQGEK